MNVSPGALSVGGPSNLTGMSPIPRSPAHRRDTSSESGKKRIPSEQWEAKRGIITRLYQEEKKSLKEVMDYLEKEHGFTATVKMFKSRIWKWGLDKKLKSDEVLAIMVLKRDRDAANKPSEFTIRDQPVDMDNINRYIKRNPQLVARFRAGDVPSMQTIIEVKCRTPSPPPAAPVITTTARGTSFRVTAPPSPQLEVLMALKEYIEESFYCGRWRWEYDVSCTTRMVDDRSDELFERTLTSLALINRCMTRSETTPLGLVSENSFSSLEEMLEPAFAALEELVAVQSPIFATRMLSLLWFLDTNHKSDMLQLIVTQLASIVKETLGPQHRMARIWAVLASDATYDYRELCESAYAMLVPLLEQRIGSANLITTMLYGDHVDYLFQSGRLDEAMLLCAEYQAKATRSGRQHPWIAELGSMKRAIKNAQDDINGTIAAMDSDFLNSNPEALLLEDDEHRAELLLRQGNLGMQAGQPSAAALRYSQAVQILEGSMQNDSGADQRLLLASLANLEVAQTRLGDGQGAAGTRTARMNLQGSFATETSALAAEQKSTRGSISSSSGLSAMSAEGRRSSGAGGVSVTGEGIESMTSTTGPATLGTGAWGTAMTSPAVSGSENGWGWSPEVFVSPRSAIDDWRFPPM